MPGGTIPPHDGHGPLHMAFAVAADALPQWEQGLREQGVAIEGRTDWSRGGHSIYFRDPDGHLLELATPRLWSTYSGACAQSAIARLRRRALSPAPIYKLRLRSCGATSSTRRAFGAADQTTRCGPSRTPSRETDSVGTSPRAPALEPGTD